jgi:hypothetical protein
VAIQQVLLLEAAKKIHRRRYYHYHHRYHYHYHRHHDLLDVREQQLTPLQRCCHLLVFVLLQLKFHQYLGFEKEILD